MIAEGTLRTLRPERRRVTRQAGRSAMRSPLTPAPVKASTAAAKLDPLIPGPSSTIRNVDEDPIGDERPEAGPDRQTPIERIAARAHAARDNASAAPAQ